MTNEMKENVIKYLTNNIEEETKDTILNYSNTTRVDTRLSNQLSALYGSSFVLVEVVQGRNINGNELNYSVAYGEYDDNGTTKGFFAIIDEYGNLIQTIDKFTSGVDIGKIYSLGVDETGYFFMIEKATETNKVRFVMLNNIVIKLSTATEYQAKIRKAYTIPQTSKMYEAANTYDNIFNIVKAVGQSRYMIFGLLNASPIAYTYPIATELVINVGSENEWNDYEGSVWKYNGGDSDSVTIVDTYATWVEDNVSFIILAQPSTYNRILTKYTKSGTDSMTYNDISLDTAGYVEHWGENAKIINNIKGYFAFSYRVAGQTSETHEIFELDLTNNTSDSIFAKGASYMQDPILMGIKMEKIGSEILLLESHYDMESPGRNDYVISVGRIRTDNYYGNDKVSLHEIYYGEPVIDDIYTFFVNKQFNLYNFNLIIDNDTYNQYQVYNSNNYNGSAVEGTRSLQPNSGILYDSNNKVLFARNLYNRVVNGGTTTSSVEVPNNYINDITIAKQDLLSYNNNILVDNIQNITTNEYETLVINFINKISMINRNNPNEPIINELGATKLNNSMSNLVDYTNSNLSKVKLNYSDNTTFTKSINPASQVSTYVYEFKFNIYVPLDKDVESIELQSGDETTTYVTIETTNLTRGKTYEITQNVEIQ